MKYIILGLLLTVSGHVFAADYLPEDSYKDFKCQKEVLTQLKNFFPTTPQWDRVADVSFDTQAFRASNEVGEWYELHVAEKDMPSVTFFSTAKMAEYKWDDKCHMTKAPGPGFEFFKQNKKHPIENFSDADLKRVLKTNKKGVIYIWSPRMVYSVTEFTRFKTQIEKKGFEFIPVLDHAVAADEAMAALKKAGVEFKVRTAANVREPSSVDYYKRLNSVELYMRNANLHFPTLFVYGNGKLQSRRIVGVMTNEGIGKSIDEIMEEKQ